MNSVNQTELVTAPSGEVVDLNEYPNSIILSTMDSWLEDNKINEVAFCETFLSFNPMKCLYGRFMTPKGYVDDSAVRHQIYQYLRLSGVRGINRKVRDLLETLRMHCYVESLPIHNDRIHTANGSVYLDGHYESEQEIVMNRLPIRYNPDAPEPTNWIAYVNGLLEPDDVPTLQEYMGYCLAPTTRAQKMLFIIGAGGEGKSRITKIMQRLLGDSMNVGDLNKLETSRFARADLENRLVMVDDDMNMGRLVSTSCIKTIVTAEGKSEIERKGEQSVQRMLYARLLCLGNGNPNSLYDHSDGFYRRQIILKTRPVPLGRVNDPYLIDRMEDEIEGILLWCIEGLKRLVANRYEFTLSEAAQENLREARSEGNNTAEFLEADQYVTFGADLSATSADLYRAYHKWADENMTHTVSPASFSNYLKTNASRLHIRPSNNILSRDGRKVRGFQGIGVLVRSGFTPYDGPTPFDEEPETNKHSIYK